MLNVVCCLWGSWPEKGWGPEYVTRLKNGVLRNLGLPHRFICFTDHPERIQPDIEARWLDPPSWKGCLPKLYVYSPEADLKGRTLVFDLDNVITGPLDEMALYDGSIAVRGWFGGYERGEKVADGDMISFEAGSFTAKKIWDRFQSDPKDAEDWTGGRERYFLRGVTSPHLWQDIVPGQVVSYKRHVKGKRLPHGARVVSFHGQPRPHKVNEPWLREHWV